MWGLTGFAGNSISDSPNFYIFKKNLKRHLNSNNFKYPVDQYDFKYSF